MMVQAKVRGSEEGVVSLCALEWTYIWFDPHLLTPFLKELENHLNHFLILPQIWTLANPAYTS